MTDTYEIEVYPDLVDNEPVVHFECELQHTPLSTVKTDFNMSIEDAQSLVKDLQAAIRGSKHSLQERKLATGA